MDVMLEEISNSLYNGNLSSNWAKLAPATKKSLAGWIDHFEKRNAQYSYWVRKYKNV